MMATPRSRRQLGKISRLAPRPSAADYHFFTPAQLRRLLTADDGRKRRAAFRALYRWRDFADYVTCH